ncbi:derlin-1.1 isoform X1 [Zea mays]|uniref:Derlin n=1 Tax=Zea mays TaxID=4577 RepID=A0A804QQN1_MAIZE|nr:derlin-1.1 isoform X1 [Zea mays]|eukprot:XP_008654204.1 derlin-1.1 isoform X1 [Zea mays]
MSSPAEYYKSLPPISKAYGTLCFFTTVLVQLQILHPLFLYLDYPLVFKKFEIWRLLTSFFFLAPFSMKFGIRLLMIARYGVMLEKGAFDKRTADFLWMMIFGAISLLSFYLPWAMLLLDVIFGSSLMPGLLGIMVGHLYYFFAVLHPLATGKSYLKTPKWVHKIVARFRIGMQANSPVRPPANGNSGSGVFRGRSYRLNQ